MLKNCKTGILGHPLSWSSKLSWKYWFIRKFWVNNGFFATVHRFVFVFDSTEERQNIIVRVIFGPRSWKYLQNVLNLSKNHISNGTFTRKKIFNRVYVWDWFLLWSSNCFTICDFLNILRCHSKKFKMILTRGYFHKYLKREHPPRNLRFSL